MPRLKLVALILLLSACSDAPDLAAPPTRPLLSGLTFEDVGRLAVGEPRHIPNVVLAEESEPSGFTHTATFDTWYRIPVPEHSDYYKAWVWMQDSTVGCVNIWYSDRVAFLPL